MSRRRIWSGCFKLFDAGVLPRVSSQLVAQHCFVSCLSIVCQQSRSSSSVKEAQPFLAKAEEVQPSGSGRFVDGDLCTLKLSLF